MTEPSESIKTVIDPTLVDILGRLTSAIDTAAEVQLGILGLVSGTPSGGNRPSDAQIQAMSKMFPPGYADDITAALQSNNPVSALRKIKEKAMEEAHPDAEHPDVPSADSVVSQCSLIDDTDQRPLEHKISILVQYCEAVSTWLESAFDLLCPRPELSKDVRGSARSLRQMQYIKEYLGRANGKAADPTRDMIRHIFAAFGLKENETQVVDILTQAVATMPEIADALFYVTGHVPGSGDAIRRWQSARQLAREPLLGERALVHLAARMYAGEGALTHILYSFASSVSPRERVRVITQLKAFSNLVGAFEGPMSSAFASLGGGLSVLAAEFESLPTAAPKS